MCVCVCVCPYLCVCVCVRVYASLVNLWKTDLGRSAIFHHLAGHKKPSNGIFGDVVAHDLDILFESQRDSNQDHFGILNVVISQMVTNRANITITNA